MLSMSPRIIRVGAPQRSLRRLFSSRPKQYTSFRADWVAFGIALVVSGGWLARQQLEASQIHCEAQKESNKDVAAPSNKKMPASDMRDRMVNFVKTLQKDIVSKLEEVDGSKFTTDRWNRTEGGEGISCVIQEGNVFERGGVNVSVVHGVLPPQLAAQMRSRGKELDLLGSHEFFASGISMVLHPYNPMAPTVHLNYRYFEVVKQGTTDVVAWWFGGGSDLTPAYLFEEDATHFHSTLKATCDKFSPEYFPRFKKWCDEYFLITHRGEARGVGGVFFDDLDNKDPEEIFSFIQECGKSFAKSYLPILEKRKDMAFTEEQKRWQQIRRGRYVEFNLVHDRGTKFGLATPGARIESILVSLPLTARWEYMQSPKPGSEEDKMLAALKKPRDWCTMKPWWQFW